VGFQITTPVVVCVLTWAVSRWRPQFPVRNSGTRPLLHFGANLAASGFVWGITRGCDTLLIGRFCGSVAVGFYSRAAALLLRPIQTAMDPVESVFVPTLSRLQSDRDGYRRTYFQVYEAIVLASLIFSPLFMLLARPLTLVILGSKWEQAAPIFAAFALGAFALPVATAANWLFISQGRGRDALRNTLIGSGLIVASFLVGLPFGPVGVGLAYSIASVCILLPIHFYFAGRVGFVTTADLWGAFFRHAPVWVVLCVAVWPVRLLTASFAPLTQLLICMPVALLASAVFICLYPPSRHIALNFRHILQVLKSRK
jgi:polysaccharide transporter, PST family